MGGEAIFTLSTRVPGTPTVSGPRFAGIGRQRKVAIIGNAATVSDAPWDDDSWEIWAHASGRHLVGRVDRFFDLHPRALWAGGKKWDPDYHVWLQTQPVPIFMQRRFAEVPASIPYPKSRVMAEFGAYFTSQAAWMIALALTEGVTHLGMFGVHYATNSEYVTQRAGCEYFLGVAWGRGVQIVIPPGNPICRTPTRLYGYESHPDGKLHDSYRPQVSGPATVSPAPGVVGTIVRMDDPQKPPLKDLGVPVNWIGGGYPADYAEGVTTCAPTGLGVADAATTTSRSAARPAGNGSSPAPRPPVKSTAGARGQRSRPRSPRPTSTKTSASATPRRSATTRRRRRPVANT